MMKKSIISLMSLFLYICALYAANSRNNPVIATYCDGSSLEIYPYSFVTRPDGSTFNCFEVKVNTIQDGLRYYFEDWEDGDYNDLVIDLWVTGKGTDRPEAHVKYISKDSAFSQALHVVYEERDKAVFEAESASPGDIFDITLPKRECGFEIEINPLSQEIFQGESTEYQVKITSPHNDSSQKVCLEVKNLPKSIEWKFAKECIKIGQETTLTLSTSLNTEARVHEFIVKGKSQSNTETAKASLEVKKLSDFRVEVSPPHQKIARGKKAKYEVSIKSSSTQVKVRACGKRALSSECIALTARGIPSHITWYFKKNCLTPGESTTLVLETHTATPCARYDFQVVASSREKTISQGVSLVVVEPGEDEEENTGAFSISFTPSVNLITLGESITYTLKVKNNNSMPVDVNIVNIFPQGFTYLPARTVVERALCASSDQAGNTLRWEICTLSPSQSMTVSFQFVVGPDAKIGRNESVVQVTSPRASIAGTAQAWVVVQSIGGLIQLGEVNVYVYEDKNGNGVLDGADEPIPDITILFEDGTQFETDLSGYMNVKNVIPDIHVISVYPYTLPDGFSVVGEPSRFVRVQEGFVATEYFLLATPQLQMKLTKKE